MGKDVDEIIKLAMSYENKGEGKTSELKMKKLTISELTYNQLEQIKIRSGFTLQEIVPMMVNAAYVGGASTLEIEIAGKKRRWYVLMSEDVREKLDELCRTSGGVSTGCMLGNIVYKVCTKLNEGDATDLKNAIEQVNWGAARCPM